MFNRTKDWAEIEEITSTPVVGNEIDGAVDVVEFVEQPIAIVVHGRTPTCGRRCAKAGRGKQDNVGDAACRELVDKGRPDGTGFGHAVDKDFGAVGHRQTVVHIYIYECIYRSESVWVGLGRGWWKVVLSLGWLAPPAFDAEYCKHHREIE